MFQKLASIKLTFYLLTALVLLMGCGVWMSLTLPAQFKAMNLVSIWEWLPRALVEAPTVPIWFLLVCIRAALLGLNAFACSLTRLWARARRTGEARAWLFFILHCFFLMVLFCHGLILFVGEKQSNLEARPGNRHAIGPYAVEIHRVVFTDDLELLDIPYKQRRAYMTRESIHLDQNFVELTLYKNDMALFSKKIFMLAPLKRGDLQVTLTEFLPPTAAQSGPGARITLTLNPLNRIFFSIYAAMILALAGFTALTWKRRHKGE